MSLVFSFIIRIVRGEVIVRMGDDVHAISRETPSSRNVEPFVCQVAHMKMLVGSSGDFLVQKLFVGVNTENWYTLNFLTIFMRDVNMMYDFLVATGY